MEWQQQLHPQSIDLGLDRIRQVFQRLQLDTSAAKIVSIAGTNGKGSCAHAVQALALAASHSVGCYTSPHLWRYNERIRINGQCVSDETIVSAFEAIEAVRDGVSLSYFEFGTLAALYLFAQAELQIWVLEVGLGGRLDAVNIVDSDVAVVTSIGLDHEAWLGSDLDAIGREKAAIARNAKPLLLGPGLPQSVADTGRSLGAQLCAWDAAAVEQAFADLVAPAGLVRSNLVLAARAANELGLQLPQARMLEVLSTLSIAGRCQRIQRDGVEEIHDVAHNLDATTQLANFLQQLPDVGPVTAVFSALQDKAVAELIQPLLAQIDTWCIAAVNDARAMDIKQLEQALSAADSVRKFDSIALALDYARQHAKRVVVCGSFLTVAAAGNESDG